MYKPFAISSCPGARNVSVAVCAPDADGELATGAGDDAAAAGELLDDPHAVASNERHAIAPAAATRRDLGA